MLKRIPGTVAVGVLALLPITIGAGIDIGQLSTASAGSLSSAARQEVVPANCCCTFRLPGADFGPLMDPSGSSADLPASIGATRGSFGPDIEPCTLSGDLQVVSGASDPIGASLGPYMDPSGSALR